MVFDNRRTYLCYDNSDLIRDGVIKTKIVKSYREDNSLTKQVANFNFNRLKHPPKGVSYKLIRKEDDLAIIVEVQETKKLLPASKIKIEIDFSKVMRNAVTHPIEPGSLGFNALVNTIATPMMSMLGMGGITSGLSYFTMHVLDAETKINREITVTKEMIETGIWECDEGYPLSVFGIVSSYRIPATEEEDSRIVKGLEFDEDDPLKDPNVIGKYSAGTWQGTARKRISGATDSNGLFGSVGTPEIKFENVADPIEQPQLFDKIVRDERKLKFRGDNYDAKGGKDYPFRLTGVPGVDATDKQIRIKLLDDEMSPLIWEGDKIYITYSVALERRVRQNLNHRGDIAQGNTVGIVGFRGAIKSEVDAFDYQIATWKVPVLPDDVEMQNIDELNYTIDTDYKLTFLEYIEIRDLEEEGKIEEAAKLHDTLEGWRLSESITNGQVKTFWAADYRGILLYHSSGGIDFEEIIDNIRIPHFVNGVITHSDPFVEETSGRVSIAIIYPASSIRDQDWFRSYLESLDFTFPTGQPDDNGNPTYTTEDLSKKIEDNIDLEREPGYLFDLTEITNSMLFDREKLPYYRPLSNSLKNVSKYKEDDEDSGIGIVSLDLLSVVEASGPISLDDMNLELYDLSYIEFYNTNSQPLKSYPCEDEFDIHAYNYPSESYDSNTLDGGQGAWYDQGHIEQSVFEWRPSGGNIESYWKLETPYFCGDYNRKSRIYTEKVSGPSLDNYSWIYTDTDPFVPSNISSDIHYNFDESLVVFDDNTIHYGLCYHKFIGSYFNSQELVVEQDINRSHIREQYDYNKDFMVGQNRILGDLYSYSHGIPIVDDVVNICKDLKGEEFWFSKEIYDNASYGLNFVDDTPKANIPSDWFIRNITIDFYIPGFSDLTGLERHVSFYFEGSESSISEVEILRHESDDKGIVRAIIDFNYYNNGPIQFLGEFWKKIKIKSIVVRYTTVNDDRNTTNLDIDDYKIKSGQNAIVYDTQGRIVVFYSNNNSSNIDAAISYDDGNEWIIHKNLIRLIEGETAGLPFVLKDKYSSRVHLFYTLNDIFLMYKRIDINFFEYEDAFVEYAVPTSYDVGDYDQSSDDPEKAYWGDYSDSGTSLRRYPSFFIAGYYDDPYFKEQLGIRDSLNNESELDTKQTPRFDFSGDQHEMRDSFKGDAYTVYVDDEEIFHLFMLSDGKLSVKRSNDYFSWKYDIEEQVIHKDYVDDKMNRGISEEIKNIQIVRNDFTSNIVSALYFHNGMLFIRHFQSNLLFPSYDSNGNMNNENMKEHLEITEDTTHLPIFLVGKIPEDIKEVKIKEIDGGINYLDSELFIYFPYNKEMLEKFDERFAVDVDTQVYAYTTKTGLIRIFYKDIFGNLNGIIFDALISPTLETMNKFKNN